MLVQHLVCDFCGVKLPGIRPTTQETHAGARLYLDAGSVYVAVSIAARDTCESCRQRLLDLLNAGGVGFEYMEEDE